MELPKQAEPVDYIFEKPPLEMLASLLPRYVEMRTLPRAAGIGRGRARRAHDRHGRGHLQRTEMIDNADAVHEPRAPGEHHQGNYRSGERRRRRGVKN